MTRSKDEIKDRIETNVPMMLKKYKYAVGAIVVGSVAGWELLWVLGKIIF